MSPPGSAPVGLILVGRNDDDSRRLAAAQAIEAVVAPSRH